MRCSCPLLAVLYFRYAQHLGNKVSILLLTNETAASSSTASSAGAAAAASSSSSTAAAGGTAPSKNADGFSVQTVQGYVRARAAQYPQAVERLARAFENEQAKHQRDKERC